MKRDWETIREILLAAESLAPGHSVTVKGKSWISPSDGTEAYSEAQHMCLLIESGYAEGVCERGNGAGLFVMITHLTWKGHELADAIRDDGVWSRTKQKLQQIGGTAALEVVIAVAVEAAKDKLGLG